MGCWKFQDINPESEEEMFTFRGHHLDTAHGEEHPERSREVSFL